VAPPGRGYCLVQGMGKRGASLKIAALAGALATATLSPAAAAATRASGSFSYTSTKPASVTGFVADFHFQNLDDPSAKPPSVAQMVVRTPPGSGVEVTAWPQCHASDAELRLNGPDACPAETKVGTGLAIADSGHLGGTPLTSTNDVTNFNAEDGIIGASVDREFPAIKNFDRTRVAGSTSTTVFPVFPGLPPPDPYTGFVSIHFEFPPLVGAGGRPWARTPPTCPRAGYWTITATFTYHDAIEETLALHSPCTAKKPHKKRKRRHRGSRAAY
jgi:hypothetical protein